MEICPGCFVKKTFDPEPKRPNFSICASGGKEFQEEDKMYVAWFLKERRSPNDTQPVRKETSQCKSQERNLKRGRHKGVVHKEKQTSDAKNISERVLTCSSVSVTSAFALPLKEWEKQHTRQPFPVHHWHCIIYPRFAEMRTKEKMFCSNTA